MATKSAIDGPAGPVVAGDHLRRDRPFTLDIIGLAGPYTPRPNISPGLSRELPSKSISVIAKSIFLVWLVRTV